MPAAGTDISKAFSLSVVAAAVSLEQSPYKSQCFIFVHNFSLPLSAPIFIHI
jgi:hypothetical protein